MRIRVIFAARHRLGDLCLQLQSHNMFLDKFDQTYIISESPLSWYMPVLTKYKIDIQNLIFVNDQELHQKYTKIKNFVDMHPTMGGWIQQQILKLAVLDHFEYDTLTIQDPDTFWIKPWKQFDENGPVMLVIPNVTEAIEYFHLLEKLTGIKRQTPNCLVTEFMTVTKEDWMTLKQTIEQKHNTNWIDAIAKNLVSNKQGEMWISEYELLGNWIIHRRNPTLVDQRRLEFKSLTGLVDLANKVDAHALSNQTQEIFWATEHEGSWEVNNFELWQTMFAQYK